MESIGGGTEKRPCLISVSFDAHDAPEVLRTYAAEHGFNVPEWQFLTGSDEQIRQVTDDYGIAYEAVEADHEDDASHEHVHLFEHNVVIVLIDGDGMVRKGYYSDVTSEDELERRFCQVIALRGEGMNRGEDD